MRVAVAVVCLLLAGCTGGGAGDDEEKIEDIPVEVDEHTGAIRGVVVDQSIVPVEGVAVMLDETGAETTTDDQGRFAFSRLEPGFYSVTASKPLYEPATTQAVVEAGDPEPPSIKMRLTKLFTGEPYMSPFSSEGHFTCSQARMPGYRYSSSSCHDNGWGGLVGPLPSTDGSDYDIILEQLRDFHLDVAPGWQTQVFEMTWKPSAQGTSDRMGMVVSTNKETRPASHSFANVASGDPMRIQIDVGEEHASAASTEPTMIPAEGMTDMSFFMSVRQPEGAVCQGAIYVSWCAPPGLAYEQTFDVFVHQFYYLPAPEGWSVMNGDEDPY